MKEAYLVQSTNLGSDLFDDCYFYSKEEAEKEMAERISVLSRIPRFQQLYGCSEVTEIEYDGVYTRMIKDEEMFSVWITKILIQ